MSNNGYTGIGQNRENINMTTSNNRAYNVSVTQLTTASKAPAANGTDKITFRGSLTIKGQTRERTVVAQGKAAALIASNMRKGNVHDLRVLFERAPANDDGGRGGEFLTVVALPRAKAA